MFELKFTEGPLESPCAPGIYKREVFLVAHKDDLFVILEIVKMPTYVWAVFGVNGLAGGMSDNFLLNSMNLLLGSTILIVNSNRNFSILVMIAGNIKTKVPWLPPELIKNLFVLGQRRGSIQIFKSFVAANSQN